MSPLSLRNLGFQRKRPEDREGLSRTRRPGGGQLGHSVRWQEIEGSHTHAAIHIQIQPKPQTRGLEGYGSSSSAPPTPQRPFPMEHGKQEVQPGIQLGRTWSKVPEDMSQRDRLQSPYGNQKRLEHHQAVQTPAGEGIQDKGESSHYPCYRRPADQTGNTQIPSGSQGVGQTSSKVASNHSGANRTVAKMLHSSQSQEVFRIRQGYKGKNKTSFSQRQKESDPMIQKLLDLVKEVHKNRK
ncbi:hypothetical protein O181_064127 [Austropuccinia psidii MF-1]|uniref:Uncharacterized protein n=1 Tax=Austropuccinia psidii MF-1 TaxID=1389203 RepID=A0A9Q3I204_9BASI|nr:hypothetical protein [Austropuccinia psidii MF-1]